MEENILDDSQRHLLQDEGFSKPPPNLIRIYPTKRTTSSTTTILKLYLEMGLRLTNFHRVLLFDQSP